MDPLPYFLLLLKKNVLLCSIIAAGSLSQVDLSQVKHYSHSAQVVDLLDYSLGEEIFPVVQVRASRKSKVVTLTFFTSKSDYFDNPERYFGRTTAVRSGEPYEISGQVSQTKEKGLGKFRILEEPVPEAYVALVNSTVYGYTISVNFYDFDVPVPEPSAEKPIKP